MCKDRLVAVKKMHSHTASDRTYSEVFAKEALLLSRVQHTQVVKLFRVCENPIALMMEFLCLQLI